MYNKQIYIIVYNFTCVYIVYICPPNLLSSYNNDIYIHLILTLYYTIHTYTIITGDPLTPFKIVPHVGIIAMTDFFINFWNLFIYTLLSQYITPIVESIVLPNTSDVRERFRLNRMVEAWRFGSGLDYEEGHDEGEV